MGYLDKYGRKFQIALYGTSHGPSIGVHISGVPAGKKIDLNAVQQELDRRRPGKTALSSSRVEFDQFTVVSGVSTNTQDSSEGWGVSNGEILSFTIPNEDIISEDYEQFRVVPRPSHIDYPARMRYGEDIDLAGGGRFSGRLTAPLVLAGAIARQLLDGYNIHIAGYASQIGEIQDSGRYTVEEIVSKTNLNEISTIKVTIANKMRKLIEKARDEGDSVGGVVQICVEGFPPGIGDPWFHSLKADLAQGMMAIPGTRGIDFGTGFQAVSMSGSTHNDPYILRDGEISTKSNHCGGIIGGISIGTPIEFRVAVKPTASIKKPQKTLNFTTKEMCELKIPGRHDPCIVPRIVVVLEAMTAIILLDHLFCSKLGEKNKTQKIDFENME